MSESIILQGAKPPRLRFGNLLTLAADPGRIVTVCGRCGHLQDCVSAWCAECHAEEDRFISVLKVADDAFEILTMDEADGFQLLASCQTFESALAAGRLLRGRLPYPAFEARLARAEGR